MDRALIEQLVAQLCRLLRIEPMPPSICSTSGGAAASCARPR
jgi:hypothetical protein